MPPELAAVGRLTKYGGLEPNRMQGIAQVVGEYPHQLVPLLQSLFRRRHRLLLLAIRAGQPRSEITCQAEADTGERCEQHERPIH